MGYIKSPQPVNKQRQSLLTTQRTPQERDRGQISSLALVAFCCIIKVIGFANLRKLLE